MRQLLWSLILKIYLQNVTSLILKIYLQNADWRKCLEFIDDLEQLQCASIFQPNINQQTLDQASIAQSYQILREMSSMVMLKPPCF